MKKSLLVCILSGLFPLFASGQQLPVACIATDAVPASLAGTSIGRPCGASAAEFNAAAMALSGYRLESGLSYGNWAPSSADNRMLGVHAAYRIAPKLSIGLFGKQLKDRKAVLLTNENGVVTEEFIPRDMMLGVSASYCILPNLSVGLSGRYASSSLAPDNSPRAFGVDITAVFRKDGLMAGIGAGTLPSMARAGFSYTIAGLTAAVEADYSFSGNFMGAGSLEYGFKDLVFVRAGYRFGSAPIPSHLSLGLGVRYAGISLNAAYLTASETLGNTLAFGVGYSF